MERRDRPPCRSSKNKMNYYDIYQKYDDFDFDRFLASVTEADIEGVLQKEILTPFDFLSLLSPKAISYLEVLAQKAHKLTLQHFGKTIQLYTPIYLSNYCESGCTYCGFNQDNDVMRRKLTPEELEKEAEFIAATGLKHVLILTGDSPSMSPVSYIRTCVKVLRRFFSSISIEVYALTENEYQELIEEGVDGLTIYQETYDQNLYDKIHLAGNKRDYMFRLNAPERAAHAGMRLINIGVLLGLSQWQKDTFFTGLHAQYLQDKFTSSEISASLPRIRPHIGSFKPIYKVSDKNIAQIILALRLFLPRLGITISTRESPDFRENTIPLGITRLSAGSTTAVGGHTLKDSKEAVQFDIFDQRDVGQIKEMICLKGYQPVLKDWVGVL
jgi:2-iminoacetate synthase